MNESHQQYVKASAITITEYHEESSFIDIDTREEHTLNATNWIASLDGVSYTRPNGSYGTKIGPRFIVSRTGLTAPMAYESLRDALKYQGIEIDD